MSLIDEIELKIQSGRGGDGVVRWLRMRSNAKGGPAGGNGGRGGDIKIRAVRNTGILSKYSGNPSFKAGSGESGGKDSLHGYNGKEVVIDLPIGSVVRLKKSGASFELLHEGEEHIVLTGGRGGFGNEHFKSSRNVTPQESTEGKPGEEDILEIELRLIADLGLVGFPNAGKSSLLNVVTHAKAKVGDYAFTTLDPNLGEFYGYIIADIPGIIEGASEGKGLGYKFLKHISRTKALVFCISVEQEEPISAYRALINELLQYNTIFSDTPFVIVLTKCDTVTKEVVSKKLEQLKEITQKVYPLSIYDDGTIKKLSEGLTTFMKEVDTDSF